MCPKTAYIASACLVSGLFAGGARGATVVHYDGRSSVSVAIAASIDPNVSASLSGILGEVPVTNGPAANGVWFFLPTFYDSIANAAANNDLYDLILTPAPGYQMTLTNVSFDLLINASKSQFAVGQVFATWNVNGFSIASPIAAGSAVDTTIDGTPGAKTTVSSAINLTTDATTTFRFFAAANENQMYLDNIRIEGTLSLIPEPTSIGLLSSCGLLLLRRRGARVTTAL
jgi:hypothetical protein